MKKNKIKILGASILLSLFLCAPLITYSQNPPKESKTESAKESKTELDTPTGPGTSAKDPLVPCGGPNQKDCTPQDFVNLIQNILNLTFMLAGFIVAGMFMYAGFLLITSVGDTTKIQKAKNIFKRTVIGFIIMFLAYLTVKNVIQRLGLAEDVKGIFNGLFK
jgi:hypothetical protein